MYVNNHFIISFYLKTEEAVVGCKSLLPVLVSLLVERSAPSLPSHQYHKPWRAAPAQGPALTPAVPVRKKNIKNHC